MPPIRNPAGSLAVIKVIELNCKGVHILLVKVGFALIRRIKKCLAFPSTWVQFFQLEPRKTWRIILHVKVKGSTAHQWWWCRNRMCGSEEDLRNTGSETCGLEALCLLIAFKSLRSWVFCWQAIMSLSRVKHIVIPASSKHLRVQLIVYTTCWCWQMLHVGITQYQKYTSHYWWG